MITILNNFNYIYELFINFFAHMLIFIGTSYVALQNRKLPQWHVTPLWYVGLTSLATCITIVCQWGIGPEFPLSYFNLGRLTETMVNVSVASVAVIMLIGTVRRDLKASKLRKSREQDNT